MEASNPLANMPGADQMGGLMGGLPELPVPETDPKLKEFFEKYPKEEEALAIDREPKKDFILTYYSEEVDADALIEKMLEEAEKVLDKEIAEGKNKPPFSELVVVSVLAISRVKIMDELIEEVGNLYEERRKLVKGKDLTDPGVIKVTQINCSKMAMALQTKIMKQAEEEAKSRNFPLEDFMNICAMVAMGDPSSYVELERIYNYRKAEESKDREDFDKNMLKTYIKESLAISERIVKGEIDSTLPFIYPHLLSDNLFNMTGMESEEVVFRIRESIKDDTIEDELVDLIIKEAYSVEKSKKACQSGFDKQMGDYQSKMMEAYQKRSKELENLKDPMDDPSIKKMIEMGLINREEAQEVIKHHGSLPPELLMAPEMMMGMGMPPGMMPPGMMPPGMMPPGGMPPGMPPIDPNMEMTPEAFMAAMAGAMPPGMMPPGNPDAPKPAEEKK